MSKQMLHHVSVAHDGTATCDDTDPHTVVTGYVSAAAADRYVSTHTAPTGRTYVVRDNSTDPDNATALDIWCVPTTTKEDAMSNETPEPLKCLDERKGECAGAVELRPPMSSTGVWFPRCDHHLAIRLEQQNRHREAYPDSDVPPSWFDPTYAGEHWNEDY